VSVRHPVAEEHGHTKQRYVSASGSTQQQEEEEKQKMQKKKQNKQKRKDDKDAGNISQEAALESVGPAREKELRALTKSLFEELCSRGCSSRTLALFLSDFVSGDGAAAESRLPNAREAELLDDGFQEYDGFSTWKNSPQNAGQGKNLKDEYGAEYDRARDDQEEDHRTASDVVIDPVQELLNKHKNRASSSDPVQSSLEQAQKAPAHIYPTMEHRSVFLSPEAIEAILANPPPFSPKLVRDLITLIANREIFNLASSSLLLGPAHSASLLRSSSRETVRYSRNTQLVTNIMIAVKEAADSAGILDSSMWLDIVELLRTRLVPRGVLGFYEQMLNRMKNHPEEVTEEQIQRLADLTSLILRGCVRSKLYELARRSFTAFREVFPERVTSELYIDYLSVMCNQPCSVERGLSRFIKQFNLDETVASYTQLLSAYFRNHRVDKALQVFSRLCAPDSRVKATEELYQLMIRGLVRENYVAQGVKLVKDMLDQKMPSAQLQASRLINIMAYVRFRDAQDDSTPICVFEMCARNCEEISVSLCKSMIHVHFQSFRRQEGFQILEDMKKGFMEIDGRKVKVAPPSDAIYATLISFLGQDERTRDLNECFDLINECREYDPKPVRSLTSMVVVCARAQRQDLVEQLFSEISSYTIPNVANYTALMTAYERLGLPSRVLSLYKKALMDQSMSKDVVFFTIAIKAALAIPQPATALEILEDMRSQRISFNPHVFKVLLDGMIACQHYDNCLYIFSIMSKMSVSLPLEESNSFMSKFAESYTKEWYNTSRDPRTLFKMIQDTHSALGSQNTKLESALHRSFTASAARVGEFGVAHNLLEVMDQRETASSAYLYNSMLTSYSKLWKPAYLPKVYRLFEIANRNMSSRKNGLPSYFYNTSLSLALQYEQDPEILELFTQTVLKYDFKLDLETVGLLIESRSSVTEALSLVSTLKKERGVNPRDPLVLQALRSIAERHGDTQLLAKLKA